MRTKSKDVIDMQLISFQKKLTSVTVLLETRHHQWSSLLLDILSKIVWEGSKNT